MLRLDADTREDFQDGTDFTSGHRSTSDRKPTKFISPIFKRVLMYTGVPTALLLATTFTSHNRNGGDVSSNLISPEAAKAQTLDAMTASVSTNPDPEHGYLLNLEGKTEAYKAEGAWGIENFNPNSEDDMNRYIQAELANPGLAQYLTDAGIKQTRWLFEEVSGLPATNVVGENGEWVSLNPNQPVREFTKDELVKMYSNFTLDYQTSLEEVHTAAITANPEVARVQVASTSPSTRTNRVDQVHPSYNAEAVSARECPFGVHGVDDARNKAINGCLAPLVNQKNINLNTLTIDQTTIGQVMDASVGDIVPMSVMSAAGRSYDRVELADIPVNASVLSGPNKKLSIHTPIDVLKDAEGHSLTVMELCGNEVGILKEKKPTRTPTPTEVEVPPTPTKSEFWTPETFIPQIPVNIPAPIPTPGIPVIPANFEVPQPPIYVQFPPQIPPPSQRFIERREFARIYKGLDLDGNGTIEDYIVDHTRSFRIRIRYNDPVIGTQELVFTTGGWVLGNTQMPCGTPYWIFEEDSTGLETHYISDHGEICSPNDARLINFRRLQTPTPTYSTSTPTSTGTVLITSSMTATGTILTSTPTETPRITSTPTRTPTGTIATFTPPPTNTETLPTNTVVTTTATATEQIQSKTPTPTPPKTFTPPPTNTETLPTNTPPVTRPATFTPPPTNTETLPTNTPPKTNTPPATFTPVPTNVHALPTFTPPVFH